MILEAKEYFLLYKISRLIDTGEFKHLDFNSNEFFRYLIDRWDKDKIKVFVSVNNKKIDGFVVCSLTEDMVRKTPQVFIDLAYVSAKDAPKNTGQELLKKVEDYAKSLNINEICAFSLKGEGAMLKKYGFMLNYRAYLKKLEKKKEDEK